MTAGVEPRLKRACKIDRTSARVSESGCPSRLKAAKMTPAQIAEAQRLAREWTPKGFVKLPVRRARSVSASWSGRCDRSPPRGHRDTAKRAVRLGGDEMALDVEGVVDGGVG